MFINVPMWTVVVVYIVLDVSDSLKRGILAVKFWNTSCEIIRNIFNLREDDNAALALSYNFWPMCGTEQFHDELSLE